MIVNLADWTVSWQFGTNAVVERSLHSSMRGQPLFLVTAFYKCDTILEQLH